MWPAFWMNNFQIWEHRLFNTFPVHIYRSNISIMRISSMFLKCYRSSLINVITGPWATKIATLTSNMHWASFLSSFDLLHPWRYPMQLRTPITHLQTGPFVELTLAMSCLGSRNENVLCSPWRRTGATRVQKGIDVIIPVLWIFMKFVIILQRNWVIDRARPLF